jgi:hypothetical protein
MRDCPSVNCVEENANEAEIALYDARGRGVHGWHVDTAQLVRVRVKLNEILAPNADVLRISG